MKIVEGEVGLLNQTEFVTDHGRGGEKHGEGDGYDDESPEESFLGFHDLWAS